MKIIKNTILLVICIIALTASKSHDKITIFMIGDSTMANKDYAEDKQERGWGMMLKNCFSDDIIVDNHALNGRSSKSFIDEGHWQEVLDKIKPGDYVFIQFGHNDEKPKPDRHTDPGTTFDANLKRFVDETRAKGGNPVLFNSVVRRNFFITTPKNDDDEALRNTVATKKTPLEGDSLVDTHGAYLLSPRNVGVATNTPFVDANRITHDLEQGLGREGSKSLHMIFAPGETPSLPKGRQDNTHYNINGAIIVANLLADAVVKEVPALKKYLRHYDVIVAKDGSGRYFCPQQAVDNAPMGRKVSIMIGEGSWVKPTIPVGKKIKFVLREGAKWKKQ